MYEQFRNEVMEHLAGRIGTDELRTVLETMDIAATGYELKRKETAIVPYDYGTPQLLKMYIVSRGIEGLSKGTLTNYNTILTMFLRDVCKNPEDVTTNDIRAWLFSYQRDKGISNRTLDGYRTIIGSFYGWAESEGYILKNPCKPIKPIKYTKKPRKAMQQIQLEYIRSACMDIRDTAVVEFLYSTGCRVSELSAVKREDVNWATGEVLLFGKGAKYRTGYINAKAMHALKNYLAVRTDNCPSLFVTERKPYTGIGKSGVERIIRILSDRVRESTGMNITPHIFRHTTATVALQNGMPVHDVQAMLGHTNISTTMIYAETNQSEVSAMHKRCVI